MEIVNELRTDYTSAVTGFYRTIRRSDMKLNPRYEQVTMQKASLIYNMEKNW